MIFQNSFLIVMGDHGHRFDPIRRTAVGQLEERLPYFSISLPEELRKNRSDIDVALETNSEAC